MAVKSFFDQLGDKITFSFPPQRIVSLVPSQTELLADLTLEKEIVGITKFCVHPSPWPKPVQIIGGTKDFRFDVIDKLSPDLIIGNKEENYLEGIAKLREKYPVWMSDIVSLEDALAMIHSVAEITNRIEEGNVIENKIKKSFVNLARRKSQSVLYLIWKKPWMAAGRQTFIDTMLTSMGLENCVAESRYPKLSEEEIQLLAPQLIFLSSEPYPFKEQHLDELRSICPCSTVMLVDGEMFSWYGSRLIKAPAYFNSLEFD